jgi:hypothetical protein
MIHVDHPDAPPVTQNLEALNSKLLMRGILLREVRKLEVIVDKMGAMGRGYA